MHEENILKEKLNNNLNNKIDRQDVNAFIQNEERYGYPFLPDAGIVLSYGEGKDFVPAGLFYITGIVDENGNYIYKLSRDLSSIYVKFSEYEYDQSTGKFRLKPSGETIHIPYTAWEKIYLKFSSYNSEILDSVMHGYNTVEDLALFHSSASEYLKHMEYSKTIDEFDFAGIPLEKVNAIYESNTGIRGTNYSIVPFTFGRIKKLCKILTRDYHNLKEEDFLNLVYYAYNDSISKDYKGNGRTR